jgi:hypothetical protein
VARPEEEKTPKKEKFFIRIADDETDEPAADDEVPGEDDEPLVLDLT